MHKMTPIYSLYDIYKARISSTKRMCLYDVPTYISSVPYYTLGLCMIFV